MKRILSILILGCALCGCVSVEQHAANRTADLRTLYPAGMSKEEVQSKLGETKPNFSASRPGEGWPAYPNKFLIAKVERVEASTGKTVRAVDRYSGVEGFMGLCYCWYYYDSNARLVDVEWQYQSD